MGMLTELFDSKRRVVFGDDESQGHADIPLPDQPQDPIESILAAIQLAESLGESDAAGKLRSLLPDDAAPNAVKVGESWYTRDALEWITEGRDRSHLVKTKVTDKNGVSRTIYKLPAGYHKTGSEHAKDKAAAKADAVSRVRTKLAAPEKLKAADIQSLGEDLKSMTKPEIHSLRKELGLVGDSKKSKQELIDKIKEHAASLRKVPYGLKELTPEQKKSFDQQDARRNTLHELLTRSGFAAGKAVGISDLTTSLGKYGLDNVQSNLAVSEMVDSGYLKPESEGSKSLIPGDSWEPKTGIDAVTPSVDSQTERQKKWQARAESLNRVIPPWVSKIADALDRLVTKPFIKESLDADVDPFELADSFIESLLDAAENDPSAVDSLLAILNGGADGTVDLQDEVAVQVGESWYSLEALEWVTEGRDRSHLVKVKRQDVNGVYRFVYVRPAGTQKPSKSEGKSPKKANQRSEAEHSANVEQLTKIAQKIKSGSHTAEDLKSFTDGLGTLTVAEIAGIKQQLGVKGGKVKADHINRVAEFAQKQRVDKPIQLADYEADRKGEVASKELFGKIPTAQEFAKLCCAVDGASLSVEGYVEDGVHSLTIHARSDASQEQGGKVGVRATRQIYRDHNGDLMCENYSFRNNSEVTGKSGTELLRDQIQELRKWGVKKIETVGVGDKTAAKLPASDLKSENGYYTWPRLGYSGEMSERQFEKLPADIRTAMGDNRDVRKLFDDIPGGPEAWKEHGDAIALSFDLAPGSVNMTALEKYLTKRGLR